MTANATQTVCLPISGYPPPAPFFDTLAPNATDQSGRSTSVYRDWIKRWMDVALVVLAAPILLPAVAVLALILLLNGGKPFYVQERVGLHGRIFRMWKLRSMVLDADEKLESHLEADPAARMEWDTTQKLKDDPRITRVGRLLRKSSLDELPQFWNVLNGSMSLVGPRPMMPSQRKLYQGDAYVRLRPGITGPWQVSLRHTSTFAGRAEFDLQYEQTLSLVNDIRILTKTLRVVCARTGC